MNSSYILGAIIGPTLLILGASMLFQKKAWLNRIKTILKEDEERVMIALLELVGGLIIVVKHNVWEATPWLVITLIGWGMVLEGAFNLLTPTKKIRSMIKGFNNIGFYQAMGVVMVALGAWMSYLVYLVQ